MDGTTTKELEADLQRELMFCPECNQRIHTVAAEGIPAQALRRCLNCDATFFMDLDSGPSYDIEMGQGGAAYNDVMFGDGGE